MFFENTLNESQEQLCTWLGFDYVSQSGYSIAFFEVPLLLSCYLLSVSRRPYTALRNHFRESCCLKQMKTDEFCKCHKISYLSKIVPELENNTSSKNYIHSRVT